MTITPEEIEELFNTVHWKTLNTCEHEPEVILQYSGRTTQVCRKCLHEICRQLNKQDIPYSITKGVDPKQQLKEIEEILQYDFFPIEERRMDREIRGENADDNS